MFAKPHRQTFSKNGIQGYLESKYLIFEKNGGFETEEE